MQITIYECPECEGEIVNWCSVGSHITFCEKTLSKVYRGTRIVWHRRRLLSYLRKLVKSQRTVHVSLIL